MPKRPVHRVSGAPHRLLFPVVEGPLPEPLPAPGGLSFIDPNPRELWIGDRRLETYLTAGGLTDVFPIRKLLRSLDWGEFTRQYKPGGRPAYAPAAMVGLIVYGMAQGRSSLRELERLALTDVACWWLTGAIAPDHSVIGRFLVLHSAVLTEKFFEDTTRAVLKVTKGDCSNVSGDATVVQAVATRYRILSAEAAKLAAEEKRQKAAAAPDDPKLTDQAKQAEEAAQAGAQRAAARKAKGGDPTGAVVSPTEPEAVLQPLKDKSMAPSYKPSALANKQRVVVSQAVHASSETAVVPQMIEQAERVGNCAVKTLKMDAGYFAQEMLELACKKDIQFLCPEGKATSEDSWEKSSKGKFPKSSFAFDETSNSYTCPAGEKLCPAHHRAGSETLPSYVLYRGKACATCPLRNRCTESPRGRTINRYSGDELREAQRAVMKHPRAREAYRTRKAEIEPVFAEVKGVQGLRRFRRRGLARVRLEWALHLVAHNMRRMVSLLRAGQCVLYQYVATVAWRPSQVVARRLGRPHMVIRLVLPAVRRAVA